MSMAKEKKAKTSQKRAKGTVSDAGKSARKVGPAERPPESAEDFGHVLRRLIGARDAQSREQDVH